MSKEEIWQQIFREVHGDQWADWRANAQLVEFYRGLTEFDKRFLASLRIKWDNGLDNQLHKVL